MNRSISPMVIGIVFCFERDVEFRGIVCRFVKMFVLLEVGEEVLKSPTFVPKFCPVVIVTSVPTDIPARSQSPRLRRPDGL